MDSGFVYMTDSIFSLLDTEDCDERWYTAARLIKEQFAVDERLYMTLEPVPLVHSGTGLLEGK